MVCRPGLHGQEFLFLPAKVFCKKRHSILQVNNVSGSAFNAFFQIFRACHYNIWSMLKYKVFYCKNCGCNRYFHPSYFCHPEVYGKFQTFIHLQVKNRTYGYFIPECSYYKRDHGVGAQKRNFLWFSAKGEDSIVTGIPLVQEF